MTFSEKLKFLRKQHKITQEQLAIKLGLERSSVAKYESKNVIPSIETIAIMAKIFNVSTDYLIGREEQTEPRKGIRIPVLGHVAAGIPIEAIEDILDYEEITEDEARLGEYFALKIKGHSMEPTISNGDVVIVIRQQTVDNGDIAIVLVDGEEATCKKIKMTPEGVMLIPLNQNYDTMFYSNKEIEDKPVSIIGKVVECRKKF